MNQLILQAQKRKETGKAVKRLREKGFLPAVLYGHNTENKNLIVKTSEFMRVYKEAGESTLIDLFIDNQPVKVLIQDIQVHPLNGSFLHADFRQVNMEEKIHTHIPIVFVGESPAVKERKGVLVTNKDEFEVSCLPGKLVHEIPVDISSLRDVEDAIYVKDITPPEGISIIDDPDEIIANIVHETQEVEEPVVQEASDQKPADAGDQKTQTPSQDEDKKAAEE